MARTSRPTTNPGIAVGYVRVSTDDQHLGPEAQRQALEGWARSHGVRLVAVHEDLGVSGGAELDRRPGLLGAIAALEDHGAGLLLVAKRDRLARDVVIAAAVERLVERKGARVLSADGAGNGEGPEGLLMRGIVDVFAQYERALIRTRTKTALAVKARRGERVGGIPYGSRVGADGKHLEREPAEERIAARVRGLRAEGRSYRAIAAVLTAEGERPRSGGTWHPQTLARIASRDGGERAAA